ncbi:MAG: CopG family transcriptional regulator [Solirubrobacterales bacterium]|nr:CopG family transcriptional regulator [Solirubrobacterales bacterium]
MRSLRLDPDLDKRVQRAAEREGVSVSEFLRRAAEERADRTLERKPSEILSFFVGAQTGDTTVVAARGKELWGRYVEEKHSPARRRPLR